ncbi:MAG TPA: hypothetical protein VF773_19910 [Verrucomicrobiae bacterium]
MANRPTQLTRFTIVLLVVLLGLSFLSGIGLWYVHEQREKMAENPEMELPRWTSACQTVHGLLNPAISAVFGYLWFAHVRGGWRMKANRKSGGTMTAMMIVLIATGVGLYYDDARRHFWFTLHLLAGLLIAFVLPTHWFAARKWVRNLEAGSATKTDSEC